jgi:rod shape-determining protein MreC
LRCKRRRRTAYQFGAPEGSGAGQQKLKIIHPAMKFAFKGKQLVIAIAVFILLIFLHSTDLLNTPERIIFSALTPAQNYLRSTGLRANDYFKNFFAGDNAGEIEILKAQMRALLVQNARLKIVDEENKLLKKELKFTKSHSMEFIPARVIGYDSLQNSNLVILEPENDTPVQNIKADMPVVADDGIIIGKIAYVKENRIFMRFITSSQSALAATILNKGYTAGVAEGELNLSIKMKMIPQSEEIKQGDIIVTSGLESWIPKGLLIGTVTKVSRDPQAPFNVALISPLYDFKNISKVLIIKSY